MESRTGWTQAEQYLRWVDAKPAGHAVAVLNHTWLAWSSTWSLAMQCCQTNYAKPCTPRRRCCEAVCYPPSCIMWSAATEPSRLRASTCKLASTRKFTCSPVDSVVLLVVARALAAAIKDKMETTRRMLFTAMVFAWMELVSGAK